VGADVSGPKESNMGNKSTREIEKAWTNLAGNSEIGLLLARRFHWNPPERFAVNIGKEAFLGLPKYHVAPSALVRVLGVLDDVVPGISRVFREFGTCAAVVFAYYRGVRLNADLLLLFQAEEYVEKPQEAAVLAAHTLGGDAAVFDLAAGWLKEDRACAEHGSPPVCSTHSRTSSCMRTCSPGSRSSGRVPCSRRMSTDSRRRTGSAGWRPSPTRTGRCSGRAGGSS
jgi:hypothetical protein